MSSSSPLQTLQRNLNNVESNINAILHRQQMLEEVVGNVLLSSAGASGADQTVVIRKKAPSTCSKVAAAALCILAIAAIAVLVACIIAACGGFPMLLSFLNMYTLGACLSLPILGCASVALILLSMFSADALLKGCPSSIIIHSENHSNNP
ncbi:inclusion membrane protein IncB [Chlamydia pecorum]|uniref:Inclusion membrane protein n=2 Tax=Chlamydia pecorum TaxID=85991 RepID=B8QS19_9CHLA|nr:inclusion membrane protein IncB [Chlamydia pecorum]ACG80729.1 inclusion membrane protein [Chlamydia pecorum]ACG80730.1 inclusion membrane protein [Chlamydia pecorum]ACG80731.1 inclusion membrane protein [Chlamydia pecorum]ACG80732.1 inclusion membrane protein [Chlamydia pecorum]ACH42154.1 inclusion membrane protein B [Chlamydia pecorum E58]